jgi:hypothetical protein
MKNWRTFKKILGIISLVLILPLTTYAVDATNTSCYSATDFGTATINGTYVYFGQYNSEPEFINENSAYLGYTYSAGSSYWKLAFTTSGEPNYYYQPVEGTNLDPQSSAGSWNKNTSGAEPPGTVSLITCPTEGGIIGSSTATTTPATFQEWLFINGLIVFLLTLLVLATLFRPARVNLKHV